MNRERILFVAVLAIVALWFFALRAPPALARSADPKPLEVPLLPVGGAARAEKTAAHREPGAFTMVTNEREHPRERLAPVEERLLPAMWPPTSIGLSTDRQAMLRRAAPAPSDGAATLTLPERAASAGGAGAAGGGGGSGSATRVDSWTSFNKASRVKGLVLGIHVQQGGTKKVLRAARDRSLPPNVDPFDRLLALLQIDPAKAALEGVVQVELQLMQASGALAGQLTQSFPDEVQNFETAIDGPERGYYAGLREYLKLPPEGYAPRLALAKSILEATAQRPDRWQDRWAEALLLEARTQVPPSVQATAQEILLALIEAETRLNNQEKILELCFEHIARFPSEESVWEYLGKLMESRAFNLPVEAVRCYARAPKREEAQRRRAALLVRLGEFDEAEKVLESGIAGRGPAVELLQARIDLAKAGFDAARNHARPHTEGETGAEALQILGAVEYALGNAAEAEKHFFAACQADPGRSTAFSDLGLALAAQGKGADALACFRRALELDRLDNAVTPRIGEAWLRINAADWNGALAVLAELQKSNPRELLTRYYAAFAKERLSRAEGGPDRLEEAAGDLKQLLEQDYRHRYAIAHLGTIQAARSLRSGNDDLGREATAYLRKAIALQPKDPLLAYVLARFLMARDQQRGPAEELFTTAAQLPAPPWEADLPLWSQAGAAALVYRDEERDAVKAIAALNRVLEEVKSLPAHRANPAAAEKHPVYVYAEACRRIVQRTSRLRDREFLFQQKPTSRENWTIAQGEPMFVQFRNGRAEFTGTIKLDGQQADLAKMIERSAIVYRDTALTGGSFSEATFRGICPPDAAGPVIVVGVGRGGDKTGPKGVFVTLDRRTKGPMVQIDGGTSEEYKKLKGKWGAPIEGAWPADGAFRIRIRVTDPEKGLVEVTLNDTPILSNEMCNGFTRSGASQKLELFVTIFGLDGDSYGGIILEGIQLTFSK